MALVKEFTGSIHPTLALELLWWCWQWCSWLLLLFSQVWAMPSVRCGEWGTIHWAGHYGYWVRGHMYQFGMQPVP